MKRIAKKSHKMPAIDTAGKLLDFTRGKPRAFASPKRATAPRRRDVFHPPRNFREKAHIGSIQEQKRLIREATRNPERFWGEQAESISWAKTWERVLNDDNAPFYRWFEGGMLNASVNCIDRHLERRSSKPAIVWQGEPEDEVRVLTYADLARKVNKFANALKKLGVKKGDRVCMYMPMIPELPIAMLAASRIGATHSVVFGAFSAEALKTRIQDAGASVLVTVDGYFRGGKKIDAWANAKEAVENSPSIKHVIVVERLKTPIERPKGDALLHFWNDLVKDEAEDSPPEYVEATHPLFILYTSGSTGRPKGVVHSTGGYLVYTSLTFRWIFDHQEDDVFWCTADIGWITGHSYILYGPLSCGATVVMFEGTPTYPEPDRFWHIVEKFKVTVFYTAPTAIRMLMKEGEEWPERHNLRTLRLLGTVGEPINPEAWRWYHRVVGKNTCPIVDTWWQTETGGILISPLPGATPAKPGSATLPFPGIVPKVLKMKEDDDELGADPNREECPMGEMGYLVITKPWPGMMITLLNDPERYRKTYFGKFGDAIYVTGDGVAKDDDGYFWLRGRIDDVLLVSGHNISTAEVESALVSHPSVAEAAVVGFPHAIKGQGIYAFVILKSGFSASEELRRDLVAHVRKEIGPIATPEKIQFTPGLPKTRSGKIMRRLLRLVASGQTENPGSEPRRTMGDTTTLLDPAILDQLLENRIP